MNLPGPQDISVAGRLLLGYGKRSHLRGSNGFQIQIAQYEPELEKYGGPSGVALAEKVFTASSEVVLALLCQEKTRPGFKQAMALLLIQELLRASEIEEQTIGPLLEFYFWYWTGRDTPDAKKQRQQTASRVEQEYAERVQLLRIIEQRAEIAMPLKNFCQVIQEVVQTSQRVLPQHVYSRRQFCFDHIHLTNNRLGIPLEEEGYLVALMLRARRETAK